MKFSEVIGQKEVWARLMQMAEEERIPHAIMFCGPKGCGKMAVALAFASYLMGEKWKRMLLLLQTLNAVPVPCSRNGNIQTSISPSLPSKHLIWEVNTSLSATTSLPNGENCLPKVLTSRSTNG